MAESTRSVRIEGDVPSGYSDPLGKLKVGLQAIDEVLNDDLDLRGLRHYPRARTEIQRARAAVEQARAELAVVEGYFDAPDLTKKS